MIFATASHHCGSLYETFNFIVRDSADLPFHDVAKAPPDYTFLATINKRSVDVGY